MNITKHCIFRNTEKWGSFGKFGNEPITYRYIKDLSDSHLLHIIEHLKLRKKSGENNNPMLQLIKNESLYRQINYIFIPEYN